MNKAILSNIKTLFSLSLLSLLAACATVDDVSKPEIEKDLLAFDHAVDVANWKQRRLERLEQPDGWLSLVGLLWLEPGENTIGAAANNDIVLNTGPDRWGTIMVDGDDVRFITASTQVTVDGESVAAVKLIADVDGKPNIVTSGTTQLYLIKRGSYALRVKNSLAPTRVDFEGLDYYLVDESWKFEGKFIPADKGATIPISNVLGQLEDSPLAGTVEFVRDGKTYRLDAIDEGDVYFFIFSDRTNGHGTYGAGRFVYTGLPANGHLTIDFNKAYNPPCAFTEYSTCPLPPPRNRLPIEVTAGEKEYRGKH